MLNNNSTAPCQTNKSDTINLDELAPQWQVVLFNDPVNSVQHVVMALMTVFKHPVALATKLMLEAHKTGRSIVEVEDKEQALAHREQLSNLKLTAIAEPTV